MSDQLQELQRQIIDFAKQIIEYKASRKDTLYVFSLYQGGDTLKLGAYAHHLKEYYEQDRIAMVCLQANSVVGEMFDHIDEVVLLDVKEKDILEIASQAHMHMYGDNWIIGNTKNMLLSHFPGPGGIRGTDRNKTFPNACEAYKTMILQVPYFLPAADVSKHFREEKVDFGKEYENAILLAPHTYSLPTLEIDFWEYLVEELNAKGYETYTNACGEESVIKGSKRFSENMKDTFNLSRCFKAVVSARSGFSDLIAFQPDVKHIVISPEKNIMDFNDIRAYGKSNQIINIDWGLGEKYSYNSLIRQIIDSIYLEIEK